MKFYFHPGMHDQPAIYLYQPPMTNWMASMTKQNWPGDICKGSIFNMPSDNGTRKKYHHRFPVIGLICHLKNYHDAFRSQQQFSHVE